MALAIAQFAVKLPDRAGTVIVVADRSESMPDKAAASEKEIIGLLTKSMKPRDQLGVVSFGREAVVEQSPQHGEFGGFAGQVGMEHSSLNDAIESALALISPEAGGADFGFVRRQMDGQRPGRRCRARRRSRRGGGLSFAGAPASR